MNRLCEAAEYAMRVLRAHRKPSNEFDFVHAINALEEDGHPHSIHSEFP